MDMGNDMNSRREFVKKMAFGAGASLAYSGASATNLTKKISRNEVWVAGICQQEIFTATSKEMVDRIFEIMDQTLSYQPDIICLPEVFATSQVRQEYLLEEKLDISAEVLERLKSFSAANNCYTIGAVYTHEGGKVYNSCVLIDRSGNNKGEYRKIHLTEDEIASGLTPGPLDAPVFETDFGKIGIQICFDMLWDDGWAKLSEKGAELVFFSSAYGGGVTVNAKAALHRYMVATSTRKGSSKLVDFTGEAIADTGFWDKNYYCAPINFEKAFLHTWPYVSKFPAIKKKYGRRINITHFHEEEWSILESRDPSLVIADVMKEFNLKSFAQHKKDSEIAQDRARG